MLVTKKKNSWSSEEGLIAHTYKKKPDAKNQVILKESVTSLQSMPHGRKKSHAGRKQWGRLKTNWRRRGAGGATRIVCGMDPRFALSKQLELSKANDYCTLAQCDSSFLTTPHGSGRKQKWKW